MKKEELQQEIREVLRYKPLSKLTPEQDQVVQLIMSGLSRSKVAKQMRITTANVDAHYRQAIEKMKKARSLVWKGYKIGLTGEKLIAYVLMSNQQRHVFEFLLRGKSDNEILEETGTTRANLKYVKGQIKAIEKQIADNKDYYHSLWWDQLNPIVQGRSLWGNVPF